MSLQQLGGLIGGIGLFLLGMWLMTDGLKMAAGGSLRQMLGRWTRTRRRGLATGFAVTALVQSSSAVTVATIGFVNAGLLPLERAVWVIFGSNVGTTATSWLVTLVGFDLRIEAFALPAVGLGMLLRLTAPGSRRGAAGEALAGFGVFFLGIALLKQTFEDTAVAMDVSDFATGGLVNDLAFVAVGFLVTLLSQSSSASIAVAITAASAGFIGLEPAAAMVIGANLGTTSTAVIAVFGATPSAKRVATAHVIFNLLIGVVAFLLLPLLVSLAAALGGELLFSGQSATAAALAVFHTLVKGLGVLLIWPLAGPMVIWLERRFISTEESIAKPQHLDPTVLVIPSMALESLLMELRRMGAISVETVRLALADTPAPPRFLRQRESGLEALAAAIGDYVRKLYAVQLPEPVSQAMGHPLRIAQHYHELARMACDISAARQGLSPLPDRLASELRDYRRQVSDCLLPPEADPTEMPSSAEAAARSELAYQQLKQILLGAASRGEISFNALDEAVQYINALRRCAERNAKVSYRFAAIQALLSESPLPEAPPDSEEYPREV